MLDPAVRVRRLAGLVVFLLSALGPLELMPVAAAQLGPLPWRVDCGDGNGLPGGEPGWLQLSETAAPAGMSLSPPAVNTVHVAMSTPWGTITKQSDVQTIDPDQVGEAHLFTSLQLADGTVLSLGGLAPNKPYRVRLELGALSPWVDVVPGVTYGPSTISRDVRVEELTPGTSQWRTLLKDVRCTTGNKGSSLATNLGGIVPAWCRVHSDASGVIQLRFSADGADPLYLAGFELHAFEGLPVQYRHTAAGPLQGFTPALVPFVAAFNAHDYDAAEEAALAVVDPWLRGCALVHVVGWLDGSRDGRFHLIDDALAALVLAQATHPGAAWLIDQLEQLRRALDHIDARGYEWAQKCPSEGGYGFLNPDCAGQFKSSQGEAESNVNLHIAMKLLSGLCAAATGDTVLADIKAWNSGTGGTGGWEPSPLVFAALKAYGTCIPAISPMLSTNANDPESTEMVQRFKDIFGNGFLSPAYDVGDFPKDVELFLFERYAQLGTPPFQWSEQDIASVLTDAQIDASWWGPEVADFPDVATYPEWANAQRDTLAAFRSVVEYWLEERLEGGELGGGLGDDVELLLQLFPAFAGQQDQGSRRMLDALDDIARHAFDASGWIEDGYYAGPMTDVEHAGEYTTNLGSMLRGAFGPTRRTLLNGLAVGEHLRQADNPSAAWAADTSLGRLHLKSWDFTATATGTDPAHAFDVPASGRGLFPALSVGGYAPLLGSHPLQKDLREWADAWRDDALSIGMGKPPGFFGPVQWPSNQFGNGGSWWTEFPGGVGTDLFSKTKAAYTLELLRLAYHTSGAADRWRYLLPAVRMFRAAQQWEDQGEPSGAPGTLNWAAGLFRDGPRFQALVVSHLQDLSTDGTLTAVDDPDLPGTAPYVDGALTARLHAWSEVGQGLSGTNLALAYAVAPVLPCGSAPVTIKSQAAAWWSYDKALPYLRASFPLLTKHVLHTDRVFLNYAQLLGNLVGGQTAGNLAEGIPQRPSLRWVGKLTDPLDLAILVNGRGWDETWVSAFACNFKDIPQVLDLWLDEGLVPGGYRVEIGPPTVKCDTWGPGALYDTTYVDKRGAGARVPIALPPGNSLVRVVRDGAASAPAGRYDLALDPPEMEILKHDGWSELVLRARVANVGSDPSPPVNVNFRASLSLPDGKTLAMYVAEQEVGAVPVAGLPASSAFTASEQVVELGLVVNQLVADILVSGLGVQLRADIEETADTANDWNQLNNSLSRLWLPSEIPLAWALP